MKNIKILIMTILIFIGILSVNMNTTVYAASYTDTSFKIGDTIPVSTYVLDSSSTMYCVQYENHVPSDKYINYRVEQYVKIEGYKATTSSGGTWSSPLNGQLAALLAGSATKSGTGYGKTGSNGYYTLPQKGLYGLWNTWVDNSQGNISSSWKGSKNSQYTNTTAALNLARSEQDKGYSVTIYMLRYQKEGAWQRLIIVIPGKQTPPEDTPPDTPDIPDIPPTTPDVPTTGDGSGNVTISGYVWEDELSGKSNVGNNQMDSGEKRLEGIKVYWKSAAGTILASTTTDSNGYYEMKYQIVIKNHEYAIDQFTYNLINTSYVQFEYNGFEYTTVAVNTQATNTSKAIENATERTKLDNEFDEISNQGVIDEGNTKYNLKYNIADGAATVDVENSDLKNALVSASTQSTLLSLLDNYSTSSKSGTIYCHEHCYSGSKGTHFRYFTFQNILGVTIPIPHYCSDPDCNPLFASHCLSEGLYEDIDTWKIENVNLGLIKREQPDLAITSDIEKVRVIMKGQEYTYIYGNRGIQSAEDGLFDYKVKFTDKYSMTYTRVVNPADIAYVNKEGTEDLQVYVTYNIVVKNQSNTLPVIVKQIIDYYDDDYSIVSTGWTDVDYNSNGYKAATTDILDGKTIEPGNQSEIISIEFRVNDSTVKRLLTEDALLKNVCEIYVYSTQYGANTICAEAETAAQKGRTGKQYAGIDIDSAAGDAVPGEVSTYQDDTDIAPTFLLMKDPNYRIISGTVWEDTQTSESKGINERLGDGVNNGEKGVENVKVELLKVNEDGTTELAKLYSALNVATPVDAVVYTDSNGNYSFGNLLTLGIIEDNYIIKYTYGNDSSELDGNVSKINGYEINARNYKSTIITQNPMENLFKGTDENDKWHLIAPDNASIAIDDLNERLAIDSLNYSTFNEKVNMTAYSNSFKVQLQYTVDQVAQVDPTGGIFEHELSIFDFGIIERPREDLVIDKTISNIKVVLANGQVLLDGDPYNEDLNYLVALGPKDSITTRQEYKENRDRLIRIEMDTELMHDAKIDITYKITFTNNSEKDYEYDSAIGGNRDYYYYGENPTYLIKQSAELVADYLDSEVVFSQENGDNPDWQIINANELYVDSSGNEKYLISEGTYKALTEQSYSVLTTESFKEVGIGESKSIPLHISKVLAIQGDSYVYENHVEVLQINGKIARTIDSVKDDSREQVTKTYKTGNYIPSLASRKLNTDINKEQQGLHEQDDAMIVVRITPPTGILTTIIYIVIAVIGLAVLVTGIIFIKKKVLIR